MEYLHRWSSALQVAACICLFSLDKQEAIPVDTHVWQLAKQHYMPHLKGQLCLRVTLMGKRGGRGGWPGLKLPALACRLADA